MLAACCGNRNPPLVLPIHYPKAPSYDFADVFVEHFGREFFECECLRFEVCVVLFKAFLELFNIRFYVTFRSFQNNIRGYFIVPDNSILRQTAVVF